MNYKQIAIIRKQNRNKILSICQTAKEWSGIYAFFRQDEFGIKYGYVGQAKKVLSRMADHLSGYEQIIDRSIKKHKLWSLDNPHGYKCAVCCYCNESELDEKERYYIVAMANKGYQMRNNTIGGQGAGKVALGDGKPRKGYLQGVEVGYQKARKEVAGLFDKHLVYTTKSSKPTKLQLKAVEKFAEFIDVKKS